MGAAFHERDTHVTAKCNVCFEGVNAAGGATKIRHAAARGANGDSACGDKGIAYARRGPAGRYANAKEQATGVTRRASGAATGRKRRATEPRGRRRARERRRAPPNRPLRPNKGVVTRSGTMGPLRRVNNSRKAEWSTTRNTFCLMGGSTGFMTKLHPAKNRPHSRHSWHRNTIPMQ